MFYFIICFKDYRIIKLNIFGKNISMHNNNDNKYQGVSCKIRCIVERVVAAEEANYFILVQFKSNAS